MNVFALFNQPYQGFTSTRLFRDDATLVYCQTAIVSPWPDKVVSTQNHVRGPGSHGLFVKFEADDEMINDGPLNLSTQELEK